jgi:hypothetical protein
LTKPQYYCARLILAEELDAPSLQILYPCVADSLVTWEVARSGNDQTRLHGVEKRVRAGLSGMILTFNDDITAQI